MGGFSPFFSVYLFGNAANFRSVCDDPAAVAVHYPNEPLSPDPQFLAVKPPDQRANKARLLFSQSGVHTKGPLSLP